MRKATRSTGLARVLVVLFFPRRFRGEYGDQMLQVYGDRVSDARREGGSLRVLSAIVATTLDLFVSGVRLRIRAGAELARLWSRNFRDGIGIGEIMASWIFDLRYAFRTLWKARGFTVVAVLTLTLGIGANTAIFSVLNGIVLTPLPYHEPDKLVWIWPQFSISKQLMADVEERAQSYAALSAVDGKTLTLTGLGDPEELSGAAVSVDHFAVLGVAPFLGRAFLPEEQVPGQDQVAILSHSLWERRFGADPEIIGRTIQLGGAGQESREVVGVMPKTFRPVVESWQAWLPLTIDPSNFSDYAGTASINVIGRLHPGVSAEQAQSEFRSIVTQLAQEDHQWLLQAGPQAATVTPALDNLVGDVRSRLVVLFAAVGLVLLIACTNVANLMLARGAARKREIGIRLAIGARKVRVVRQFLTETTLLGLCGGIGGVGAAYAMLTLTKSNLPASVPRSDLITIDVRVLLFTLGLSLMAGLIFGILPALRNTSVDLQPSLHEGTRGSTIGGGRQRLNKILVIVETALAVVLVVGAGLMIRSFWVLSTVDPGFNENNMVTMRVSAPATRYPDGESLRTYYGQVKERLEAAPGVVSVSMINLLPMTWSNMGMLYEVDGEPTPNGEQRPRANARSTSPGYFRAMGIPLVNGRGFEPSDRSDAPLVVIVNETMASQMAPDGNAIGKRIGGFSGEDMYTVVGVVADIHQHSLKVDTRPEMYFPYALWSSSNMYLMIRVEGETDLHIAALQRTVWSVDEDVPISRVRTMEEVIARSVADSRFLTMLLGAFAVVALALGIIGVYGVLSYAVSQRTQEIGVRMALGAGQGSVLRSALAQGVLLVVAGIVVGIIGALGATRLLSSYLFGVSATDPVTFAAVGLLLIVVAIVASFVPARRASMVDPMVALRLE